MNANSDGLKFLGLGSDLIQVFWVIDSLKVDLEYPLQSDLVSDLGHPLWVVWMAFLLLI